MSLILSRHWLNTAVAAHSVVAAHPARQDVRQSVLFCHNLVNGVRKSTKIKSGKNHFENFKTPEDGPIAAR